jgi:hypothetical protein
VSIRPAPAGIGHIAAIGSNESGTITRRALPIALGLRDHGKPFRDKKIMR